ncbi:decarboxylase [Klebsiella pneumoniae]|uniref:AMP nucleosidase n=1 Tax=Klebsiella pneumoniae TaxID=573 RepID=A0A2X3CS42_KLEPN|nr:decarboxylase [Klebsiella pneumoniae]
MTEPSIIAAEPPNPLVNELIIMPDIEKRLEAFVRIAHGIIISRAASALPKSCSTCWVF